MEVSGQTLSLTDHEVHVWHVDPDQIVQPRLLSAYQDLLTPDERTQHQRFRFPQHRHLYLVARALMRSVASLYAPVDPAQWRFERNHHGKPEISGPPGVRHVRLNLSHTEGSVACAVTSHCPVGVDVEDLERRCRTVEIADHYFSPEEVRDLMGLPPEHQRLRFFEYWTLKESYIKARGLGLAIPLDQFTFDLQPELPIRISFGPAIADEPDAWQFSLHRLKPRHLLAVGVKPGKGRTLSLRLEPLVPLLSLPGDRR